ncbi:MULTISPECIES: serine hydrolase domain-containing protein [unclassified Sphingobium]|uniref:serine hydrolase domain-containing protein n=1 Tax=unclassified Sphingobium TaxID=2611147 RepID=UPI0022242106|nr:MULTISPECIES: serine hydrolase [unclassified Sphingobium]MCW2413120.1 CubicO group peptidase (beta-lactamase class C family) [Sphingobium sp. B8D3D]MCW2414582.1 CubicO group peptidase (beta-lactamase class C family) [Sphingobium sp. B8D3A]
MKNLARRVGLALAPIAICTAPALAQQELPPVLASGAKSDVAPAVQILRWHMNDADVASLTFRSMDTLFTTRSAPRSGPIWQLPRNDKPLDFSYAYKGTTYKADDFLERTYTNALLVMKDGKIVTEIYRNNSNEQTRFMGWSMTKSLTSILIGSALAEGRIKSLDDPITAYLPELKGSGYDGVSIRHILQMRSGVDYEERYDFANPGIAATNHINALVKNVSRFADMARQVKRLHTPGTVFQYKTIDTAVLGWLIERVSGGDTIAGYATKHLWEPLGAERDGFFIMDGPPGVGREFNGAGYNATLRDWARVGQMMLDGGKANGKQIVSAAWVAESTRPTDPKETGPMGYGYQWWTLGGGSYSAIGLQGQYVFVDPASRTVVVKLSYFPPANMSADEETAAFLKAAAAWTPR